MSLVVSLLNQLGLFSCNSEFSVVGLTNVWLECDSTLVCVAFIVRTNVPWMLCNR